MVYIYIYQWKDLKTIVDISSPSPLQERFFSQVCDAAELLELTFGKSQPIEMEPPGFVPARNAVVNQYGSMICYTLLKHLGNLQSNALDWYKKMIRQSQISTNIYMNSSWIPDSCLLESLLKIHRLYGRWSLRGEILRKNTSWLPKLPWIFLWNWKFIWVGFFQK